MDRKQLVVCAIFENEAAHLPEWLAYHHAAGVEHFVLYDNDSTDASAQAVRDSAVAQHVTLIRWPQRPGQVAAYRHFIDIFAPSFEWVAFLDVTDFLLPLNSRNIADALQGLTQAAAVLVQQRLLGPGTWQEAAPGLVIENLARRTADDFPANRQIRTIARCTELLDVALHPHEFLVNGPAFNTAGDPVTNSAIQAQPCYQNLVINQYHVRSRQDWVAKFQHANATAHPTAPQDEVRLFDHLAEICQVSDETIRAFVPAVRALVGDRPVAGPSLEPRPRPSQPGPSQPGTSQPEAPVSKPVEAVAGWLPRGPDALERAGGLGLVFRDRSRPGEHWLAALRGAAADAIDPAFLLDDFDRLRDFPTDAEARAACDAALARTTGR
jgi:hypothetical protein